MNVGGETGDLVSKALWVTQPVFEGLGASEFMIDGLVVIRLVFEGPGAMGLGVVYPAFGESSLFALVFRWPPNL